MPQEKAQSTFSGKCPVLRVPPPGKRLLRRQVLSFAENQAGKRFSIVNFLRNSRFSLQSLAFCGMLCLLFYEPRKFLPFLRKELKTERMFHTLWV